MRKSYGQHCGLARALDRIGERWTLLIVRELLLGPARYTDLRAALPGMATNLLADRLRALEVEGVVARRVLPPPAAATVYELTETGRGLEDAVHALIRWGGRWMAQPVETDVLRPQWLALAVAALTRPDGHPLICELDIDGQTFTLRLDDRAGVTTGSSETSDVTLATDSRTLLAVASGARRLDDAIDRGFVSAQGPADAIAVLARIWAQQSPGRPSRAS